MSELHFPVSTILSRQKVPLHLWTCRFHSLSFFLSRLVIFALPNSYRTRVVNTHAHTHTHTYTHTDLRERFHALKGRTRAGHFSGGTVKRVGTRVKSTKRPPLSRGQLARIDSYATAVDGDRWPPRYRKICWPAPCTTSHLFAPPPPLWPDTKVIRHALSANHRLAHVDRSRVDERRCETRINWVLVMKWPSGYRVTPLTFVDNSRHRSIH